MKIGIIQKDGPITFGEAILSKGRGKKSVYVVFDEPLKIYWPLTKWEAVNDARPEFIVATNAEFYLTGEYTGQIMIWGQGAEYSNDSLQLHPDDCAQIMNEGGG